MTCCGADDKTYEMTMAKDSPDFAVRKKQLKFINCKSDFDKEISIVVYEIIAKNDCSIKLTLLSLCANIALSS